MRIYKVLIASRFIPRLLGAAPFALSNTNVKFCIFGLIWSLVQLPIILAAIYLHRDVLIQDMTTIYNFALMVLTGLECYTVILNIIKDGIYQNAIIDVIKSMDDYDKKSGYLTSHKSEMDKVRTTSLMYSIILFMLDLAKFCGWNLPNFYIFIELFAFQIDNSIFMFTQYATLLGLRFRHLSSLIERKRCIEVQSSHSSTLNLEYIHSLYVSLVSTGEKLNSHYSDRLLLWSTRALLALVVKLLCLVTEQLSSLGIAVTIFQLVPIIFGLIMFTTGCHFIVDQANNVVDVILMTNICLGTRIDRGRKEIFALAMYINMTPVVFTALGFFNIDIVLIFEIMTTSLTYAVLCWQTMYSHF